MHCSGLICSHSQKMCGLVVWLESVAMWVKGSSLISYIIYTYLYVPHYHSFIVIFQFNRSHFIYIEVLLFNCASNQASGPSVTVHMVELSLNQYGSHITNVSHTAIMLNRHVAPNFANTCQTQPTGIPTSHVTAKYRPETNMPTKLGIYATYLMGLYGRWIHIYVPLIK